MNKGIPPTDEIGKPVVASLEAAAELIGDPDTYQWACDLEALTALYEKRLARTGYVDTCNILASLYLLAGRTKDALPLFERCVEENPDFTDAWANLAFTLLELGLLPQAQAVFPRLLKTRPANARLPCLYGVFFAVQGAYEEAAEEYRRALDLNPDYDLVHNYMALAQLALGEEKVALEHVHRALSLQPFYQGVGILKRNEIDLETMERYRSVVEVNPLRARCFLEGAYHHAAIEEEDRALRVLGEAIAIEPDFARYYTALGFLEMNWDRRETAMEHLKLALDVDPNAFEPHVHLGFLLGEEGQMDLVVEHFEEAVRVRPYYPNAHFNLGEALLDVDRLDEAIACFRRALTVHPFYAMAVFKFGYACREAGRNEEAAEAFTRLKSIDPRFPDVDEFLRQSTDAARPAVIRRKEQP